MKIYFEILKILTGDNPHEKKACLVTPQLNDKEKEIQIQRIARKFKGYSDEVKELLEQRYPREIKEVMKELERVPATDISGAKSSDLVDARAR